MPVTKAGFMSCSAHAITKIQFQITNICLIKEVLPPGEKTKSRLNYVKAKL